MLSYMYVNTSKALHYSHTSTRGEKRMTTPCLLASTSEKKSINAAVPSQKCSSEKLNRDINRRTQSAERRSFDCARE